MIPDYSGRAVTIRVAESGGTSGDIGVWRNACPVDCGWHGSDWEGRWVAEDHRAEEAEAHECLRADTARGEL